MVERWLGDYGSVVGGGWMFEVVVSGEAVLFDGAVVVG